MNYRTLGKRNPNQVSILGFGCMRLPTVKGNDGEIDELEATNQIKYAIDKGLNYLDTAWIYHQGNSEGFLAKLMNGGYREKVYIADKLPSWLVKSREDMDKYLDLQMERLDVEYIDYYLLHALNKGSWDNLVKHNVFDFIEKALSSGKIRNIGFSFHDTYEAFDEIINAYDWDFCQIQMNFYDEEYQAGLKGLELAGSKDIGVIIMEPLRGGNLALNVPDTVMDIYNSTNGGHSAAGWALRYLWNKEEVKLVLSGMNQFNHIDDNIKEASQAWVNMLNEDEAEALKKVKNFYKSKIQVDCTACKYCMPCPFGVNIPGNFSMFNNAFVFDNVEKFKDTYYRFIPEKNRADVCKDCGVCVSKCPQHIDIPRELEKVNKLFAK